MDYEKKYKEALNRASKFREGEWVAYNHNSNLSPRKIIQITNKHYVFNNDRFEFKTLEADWHLWTIQDAKDGDVLFTTCNNINEMVFIYHGIEFGACSCYFLYSHTGNECKTFNSVCSVKADIHPATKEQRELLFKQMKEAGYEWDADKKELKKIEQKPTGKVKPKFNIGDTMRTLEEVSKGITNGLSVVVSIDDKYYHCNNELIAIKDQDDYEYPAMNRKQDSVWSKEDEAGFGDAMWAIEQARTIAKDENDMGNLWYAEHWLKSLKDRVQPQPKQKWSEEDMSKVQRIREYLNEAKKYYADITEVRECMEWLDTLKDKVQPNPIAWSEEDKNILDTIIYTVENKNCIGVPNEIMVNWLKSIKNKYAWKPSEKQMNALDSTVQYGKVSRFQYEHLNSLFNDLKKLRGD